MTNPNPAAPLTDAAADVREHHRPNEWDSCVACRRDWPCDAELLAELVMTRLDIDATLDAARATSTPAGLREALLPVIEWALAAGPKGSEVVRSAEIARAALQGTDR